MPTIKGAIKKVNAKFYPRKLLYNPSWIILCVNNACNLHCKMCDVGTKTTDSNFYQHMMGAQPINMPIGLLKNIIDQTASYFPKAKLGYAFTEPSVYPHLLESLAYAQSKNIFTSLTTNGLQLAKQAEDLCKAGLKELNVSLDGPADIHNFIRGHKQSFEKAFEGISKILSLPNAPEVSVYCAITEWNIGRLIELAEIFRAVKIKQMGFMHTVYVTDLMAQKHNALFGEKYFTSASNVEEVNLTNYNLQTLWKEYQKLKSENFGFPALFIPDLKSENDLKSYYETENPIGNFCNDAFSNIMIKTDGNVIPAHSRCYQVTTGNLYQNNLKEIWNSKVASTFRKDLVSVGGLLPACSRCCSAH
ncbi:MAG: radical SAM protein [Bacteroidetes bacterium]|nr:radical SAM protein [Bacteroidota bacterium]